MSAVRLLRSVARAAVAGLALLAGCAPALKDLKPAWSPAATDQAREHVLAQLGGLSR